jgi:hypothetical protein
LEIGKGGAECTEAVARADAMDLAVYFKKVDREDKRNLLRAGPDVPVADECRICMSGAVRVD